MIKEIVKLDYDGNLIVSYPETNVYYKYYKVAEYNSKSEAKEKAKELRRGRKFTSRIRDNVVYMYPYTNHEKEFAKVKEQYRRDAIVNRGGVCCNISEDEGWIIERILDRKERSNISIIETSEHNELRVRKEVCMMPEDMNKILAKLENYTESINRKSDDISRLVKQVKGM